MAVASSRGHEVQDLLVGLALHGDPVDAHQLIGRTQPAVLLGGAQRDDGPDVDLTRQPAKTLNYWLRLPHPALCKLTGYGSSALGWSYLERRHRRQWPFPTAAL